MRLIDADALERDGWRMSRIVQIDEKTMEAQTRKPTDFPTIESAQQWHGITTCGVCVHLHDNYCPVLCGRQLDDYCSWAEREGEDET